MIKIDLCSLIYAKIYTDTELDIGYDKSTGVQSQILEKSENKHLRSLSSSSISNH